MADIQITCTRCFTVATVSEFVDDSALVCRSCGAELTRPSRPDARAKPTMAATRDIGRTDDEQPSPDGNPIELWPGGKRAPRHRRKHRALHHWYAFGLFLALGSLMAYWRYGGGLSPVRLELLRAYAAPALLGLHVLIILKAFEDQVFQGILCLLVPLYSLYYAFGVMDSLYVRALIAAVLIGIGQDAAEVSQLKAFDAIEFVRRWIAKGG
jgi:hypothetical protein